MKNEPIELEPTEAVNDVSELVLDDDEIKQLAKFLDALLEVDIANRNNGSNVK
jgi:hypothetical protein